MYAGRRPPFPPSQTQGGQRGNEEGAVTQEQGQADYPQQTDIADYLMSCNIQDLTRDKIFYGWKQTKNGVYIILISEDM